MMCISPTLIPPSGFGSGLHTRWDRPWALCFLTHNRARYVFIIFISVGIILIFFLSSGLLASLYAQHLGFGTL